MAIRILPPDDAKKKARANVEAWKRQKEKEKIVEKGEASTMKPEPEGEKSQLNQMLFDAIEQCDFQKAMESLESGADVNARDSYGHTPLLKACFYGDDGSLFYDSRSLIQPDRNDWATLIHMHTKPGDRKGIVRALMDANADLDSQNYWGETALMVAAFRSNLEYVNMLLSGGADPKIRDYEGLTALGYVLENMSYGPYKETSYDETSPESLKILADMLRKAGATE